MPCPFCGGEAEIRGDRALFVQCAKCGTRYGDRYHVTKAEAIAAWNTRYHSEFEKTVIKAWKEIKDYTERTCHRVDVNGYSFRFECSACGYVAIVHNCETRLDELPCYCPNCGARVVS